MREKKPFNDVTDHYKQHVGLPSEKVDMKKLPKLIRLIGYFFVGGLLVALLLYVVALVMTYM